MSGIWWIGLIVEYICVAIFGYHLGKRDGKGLIFGVLAIILIILLTITGLQE
jgi:hypothetical protein